MADISGCGNDVSAPKIGQFRALAALLSREIMSGRFKIDPFCDPRSELIHVRHALRHPQPSLSEETAKRLLDTLWSAIQLRCWLPDASGMIALAKASEIFDSEIDEATAAAA